RDCAHEPIEVALEDICEGIGGVPLSIDRGPGLVREQHEMLEAGLCGLGHDLPKGLSGRPEARDGVHGCSVFDLHSLTSSCLGSIWRRISSQRAMLPRVSAMGLMS